MWLFSSRTPRTTEHALRRRNSFRPCIEALEDRCLLNAGALDPAFGNGAGYVTTAVSSGTDRAFSALIQPDGKIIATGIAFGAPGPTYYQAGMVRYNSDGSLDTSFGNGGVVLNAASPNAVNAGLEPMAALYPSSGTANDGKIVLSDFSPSFSLARYNANGALDTSFGNNGIAMANFGSTLGTWDGAWAVIQPDGKIVAVGTSFDEKTLELARFNADGSLDVMFGKGGLVTTAIRGYEPAYGNQNLLLQPNGGLIVKTDVGPGGSPYSVDLIGYNADGSLNTSFGARGFVLTPPMLNSALPQYAALYPANGTVNDGKIVLTGFGITPGGSFEWMVKRYNANGTLDSSFGNGGTVFASSAQTYMPNDVVIQPDGKLVVVGRGITTETVVRYNTDGSLDSTFGTGGIVTTAIIGSAGVQGFAVVLQANGDIVVAGSSGSNFAVTRYLGYSTMAVAGFPAQSTAGVAGTFTVTAENPSGGTNTVYTGTVHFTSSDRQAVLPPDYTFTAADQGTHTFIATLDSAASQSITATDTVTASITGNESDITVKSAAAAVLILSSPSSVTHSAAFSLTLTVEDAYGNVVTGDTGTVQFTSSDSSATLPKNYTFMSGDGGVHIFVSAVTLKKRGSQTITVADTQNSALTATDSISVT